MAWTREQLAAQIVLTLVSLRVGGVVRGPCSLTAGRAQDDALADGLWQWARLLGDVHALIDDCLVPALREPGRLHRRRIVEVGGRPRGAVRWPQTVRRNLSGPRPGGPRFVCSHGERSMLAPENLLLLSTLDGLEHGAQGVRALFDSRALLNASQRRHLGSRRARVLEAMREPWVAACRERVREVSRSGTHLGWERALEGEVRGRTSLRPQAAPDWARRLLELRSVRGRGGVLRPEAFAGAYTHVDEARLWSELAHLVLLELLAGSMGLEQEASAAGERPLGFRARAGADYRKSADEQAWLVGGLKVGTLVNHGRDWGEVRRAARLALWDYPASRWIIVHRCEGAPAFALDRKDSVEMLYWRPEPGEAQPLELQRAWTRWSSASS